jgi:glucosamine-phosphate N-acetyltransferase
MTDILIRKSTKVDLSNGLLETLSSLKKISMANNDAELIFENILNLPNQEIFVCVIDSKIVGTATLLIEQKLIHNGSKVGHIEDVSIHEEFQKLGIGTKLIQFLINHAQQNGCYKVVLSCLDEIMPFYQKIGFSAHLKGMRYDLS